MTIDVITRETSTTEVLCTSSAEGKSRKYIALKALQVKQVQ